MSDNILEMFLEDTREHLADIETDLLDIEEAGADYDPELLNKIFRTAHSIKGSAGFLALDSIRDLSHRIESVLDMMRSDEIQPVSSVINIILRAFDRLQELVDNIHESNSMDISEHVATLTALVQDSLPEEEKHAVTSPARLKLQDGRELFAISQHDLNQARKGGNYVYMVEYDLIHDVHKKDKTPLDLMKGLEKSGLILDCKTDISSVGDLESELSNRIPFFVLYATILEPELCKAIFQVDEKYIHHVREGEEVLESDSAPAAEEERKPVDASELDDLERQLDLAMSAVSSEPGSVSPGTPHPSLMAGFESKGPASEQAAEEAPEAQEPAPQQIEPAEEVAPDVQGEEPGELASFSGGGEEGTLSLSGQATIENSAALREAMLKGLERCNRLTLDLSRVEAADLALLQLLFAANRTAANKGGGLAISEDVPEAVQDVARRAGLSHKMQDGFQGIFQA